MLYLFDFWGELDVDFDFEVFELYDDLRSIGFTYG